MTALNLIATLKMLGFNQLPTVTHYRFQLAKYNKYIIYINKNKNTYRIKFESDSNDDVYITDNTLDIIIELRDDLLKREIY